ncbi:MAG: glycosyltransferase [Candidatus Brocadiae bacterium]|nr:glycosyltransferase [Candidatus Brocadiia bacterium]
MNSLPLVTLIVPLFNRPLTLARILRALDAQTLPPGETEAIFVDDSGSESYARQQAVLDGAPPRCAWKRLETGLPRGVNGVSVARNLAIRAARGEVLVFMDDDCVPHPRMLEEHARAYEGGARRICVGNRSEDEGILKLSPPLPLDREKSRREMEKSQRGELGGGDFITANASARRGDVLEAGLFDERFARAGEYGYEDRDLGDRLLALGLPFCFLRDAAVWIAPRESEPWEGAKVEAGKRAHARYRTIRKGLLADAVRAVRRKFRTSGD